LVWVPGWIGHLELTWQNEISRQAYEFYARRFTLVRYDKRGTGLSDRDLTDYSIEGRIRDVEAVVEALGLQQHALMAASEGGPIAIAYAARYPERVTRLALQGTFASGRELVKRQRNLGDALIGLIRAEWGIGSHAMAKLIDPDAPRNARADLAQQEGAAPEAAAQMIEAMAAVDVTGDLSKITAPTIVVHGRNDQAIPFELGRELASEIPNARFFPFDGGHMPGVDGTGRLVGQTTRAFLAGQEDDEAPSMPARELPSGTAIILFLDIADSTALTEQLGDAPFRDKARLVDTQMRELVHQGGGTPVDGAVLGDGMMAVFTSAREAIDAAQRCHDASRVAGLALHAGIHAGDVIREETNVYGGAVNIAARVASESAPDEILVSQTVRDLARTSAGVSFEDRGERSLKGIEEPVRVFAVRAV
jgi:class 3 adenylate cyclase/pimeloyl-ACP methyl ester carboxylesterase